MYLYHLDSVALDMSGPLSCLLKAYIQPNKRNIGLLAFCYEKTELHAYTLVGYVGVNAFSVICYFINDILYIIHNM